MAELDPGPFEKTPGEARGPIRRKREDRVLAGVCSGLGDYLGIDPLWIRIAFVALSLGGGSGVLLYIIAVLAIPEEDST